MILKKLLAERSFDLRTSGLWAQHASTAPLCYYTMNSQILNFNNLKQKKIDMGTPTGLKNPKILFVRENFLKKTFVRSGIRTHAHRSGLRPERSALDHSAILTWQ